MILAIILPGIKRLTNGWSLSINSTKNFTKLGKQILQHQKNEMLFWEIKAIYYCHQFLKGKNFKIETKQPIDFEYEKKE